MSELIFPIRRGQIVAEVEVAVWRPDQAIPFRGLIDTGAQESGISRSVVAALGDEESIEPHSFDFVKSFGGPAIRTPFFALWMGFRFSSENLPDAFGGMLKPYWLMPHEEAGFDVLVGMDIIERFAVSIDRGVCTLRRRDAGLP